MLSHLVHNMIFFLDDFIWIHSFVIWLFFVISRCSILEVSCILSFHVVLTSSDLVLDSKVGSLLFREELFDLFDSAGLHARPSLAVS